MLILPYLIGWSMGIWGPGSPRWLLLLGIVVGLWYLAILAMILKGAGGHHRGMSALAGIFIGTFGVLSIGGCITALVSRRAKCFDSPRSSSGTCDGLP